MDLTSSWGGKGGINTLLEMKGGVNLAPSQSGSGVVGLNSSRRERRGVGVPPLLEIEERQCLGALLWLEGGVGLFPS